jgi:hypothetical protein
MTNIGEIRRPRVTDHDNGEITVDYEGIELRGWSYSSDAERRIKMLCAREYIEGWCDRKKIEDEGASS